tara:strand:- start:2421 stop:2597 length:177 start_codon:yes stop_codon:yes gene_type:complete
MTYNLLGAIDAPRRRKNNELDKNSGVVPNYTIRRIFNIRIISDGGVVILYRICKGIKK